MYWHLQGAPTPRGVLPHSLLLPSAGSRECRLALAPSERKERKKERIRPWAWIEEAGRRSASTCPGLGSSAWLPLPACTHMPCLNKVSRTPCRHPDGIPNNKTGTTLTATLHIFWWVKGRCLPAQRLRPCPPHCAQHARQQ